MTSRSVLGRPRRTKVYESNFNAGERYYRPVVDSLDRKGTGRVSTPEADTSFSRMRANLLAESEPEPVISRRRAPRIDDDVEFEEPRRKVNSALLDEYDSIFENRNRTLKGGGRAERSPNTIIKSLEDEADKEISAYLKRIQDQRPARPTMEDEFESEITPRNSKRRQQIDFQEKLLDSVNLKNSHSLENDAFFKKRTLRVTAEDDEEAPSLTKWTSLKSANNADGDSDDFGSASARARKTRNRLQDLNAEIEDLSNRAAARDKRVAQLREFVKENEANNNAIESALSSSTRVVQKASVRAEKKTVTF